MRRRIEAQRGELGDTVDALAHEKPARGRGRRHAAGGRVSDTFAG